MFKPSWHSIKWFLYLCGVMRIPYGVHTIPYYRPSKSQRAIGCQWFKASSSDCAFKPSLDQALPSKGLDKERIQTSWLFRTLQVDPFSISILLHKSGAGTRSHFRCSPRAKRERRPPRRPNFSSTLCHKIQVWSIDNFLNYAITGFALTRPQHGRSLTSRSVLYLETRVYSTTA